MAHGISPLDTAHNAPLHAARLDHWGRCLATAADNKVRLWDWEERVFLADLEGHTELVRDVAWSHPHHGHLLATVGEDKKVCLWREAEGQWCEVHRSSLPGAGLACAFSPWEYGLQLAVACAGADGYVVVLSRRSPSPTRARPTTVPEEGEAGEERGGAGQPGSQSVWIEERFKAHEGGTFALCWGPATCLSVGAGQETLVSGPSTEASCLLLLGPRRLVTGGADKQVRIWRHDELTDDWADQHHLTGEHHDWVRDVAWRPKVGIPTNTIASCAEDGTVVIWSQVMDGQAWKKQASWKFESAPPWQVAWSVTGSMLAVSLGDNEVKLYQEQFDGRWKLVDAPMDRSSAEGGHEDPTRSPPEA